ncbi:dihydroxyacetone kinase [Streptococcus rupicaprae]|uniref:DhaKLM operon coactivator DhaQ n=1 Tax=Streptococcus rupicaprae TaxID=759619 RepID=A0ABV2FF73_9STRE
MDKHLHYIEKHIHDLLTEAPHIKRLGQSRFLYDSEHDDKLVPLLSGGGSGHEPAHFGYIGQGMLAGAIAGDLFIPPTPQEIIAAIRFLDKGQGVFVIIKNFLADIKVFQKAIEVCRQEGRDIRYIISHDDISVEERFSIRHRGVAGTLFLHKILGQAAQEGASLEHLEQLALKLAPSIATLGVATRAPHCLLSQKPLFHLQEGFISYGVGIHGEAGYRTVPFISSEKLAIELINKLRLFFRWKEGQGFALLINNLGQTPPDVIQQFQEQVLDLLDIEGLKIEFVHSGRFMTNLDMEGISLSLCDIRDHRWIEWLSAETTAPAWQ